MNHYPKSSKGFMSIDDVAQDAITRSEIAIADIARRDATDSLATTPYDQMFDLATTATNSTLVMGNALGTPLSPDATPDALRDEIMSEYLRQRTDYRAAASAQTRYLDEMSKAAEAKATLVTTLGMSDEDVARIDMAAEAGDPTAWRSELCHFYYG